jgi:SAM-dependent methyltransferase
MKPGSPLDADTEEVLSFVTRALPPRATVLEVGAGDGRLTARLDAAGWRVKAIDIDAEAVEAAKARGVDAARVDFFDVRGERFDALLFTRSFHHLSPLSAAIAHSRELVAPGGTLVLDEFAHDAIDLASAAWFYDVQALLEEAGALAPGQRRRRHHDHHHEEQTPPKTPLERWQRRHTHEPPLHGAKAMVDALSAEFEVQSVERLPYLYRYLAERLAPDAHGARLFQRVRVLEEERIALRLLVPIGIRLTIRVR